MSISGPVKIIGGGLLCLLSAALTIVLLGQVLHVVRSSKTTTIKTTTTATKSDTTKTTKSSLPSTPATQYGDKYASGILPVGDSKYTTSGPKKGYVYLCHAPNGGEGGAGSRGPWFTNNNTQYDINKKAAVSGTVAWQGQYSMQLRDGKRIITTNDVPNDHTTGMFPIASSDTAYLYDRNPNSIQFQALTYTLTAAPTALATPACMAGESGVMNSGVALFNGFDAGGRDAGAWEVQDGCAGHPQKDGEYHYHTLSSCIKDVSSTTVIGYALDGYPITGPTVAKGNIITSSDLDECHGMTSTITLDGVSISTYHYVMTQDFPYSVSCFKATPIRAPMP